VFFVIDYTQTPKRIKRMADVGNLGGVGKEIRFWNEPERIANTQENE
jgi:hypothetical protein